MEALLILVIVAALLALGYAAFNFIGVKKLDEGTDRMKEIAAAIRVGANADYCSSSCYYCNRICSYIHCPVWRIQLGAICMFHDWCYHECISRLGRYEDCYLR